MVALSDSSGNPTNPNFPRADDPHADVYFDSPGHGDAGYHTDAKHDDCHYNTAHRDYWDERGLRSGVGLSGPQVDVFFQRLDVLFERFSRKLVGSGPTYEETVNIL